MIPIYQHYVKEPVWKFIYSPALDERGWTRAGVAFQALKEPATGTVPIHQLHAEGPWRAIYSRNQDEGSGWQLDHVAFHAFDHQAPGTVPVYGYRASEPFRKLYTTGDAGPGWTKDDVAFYAYPGDLVLDFEFARIDYGKLAPPDRTTPKSIAEERLRNDSPAEISSLFEESKSHTSTFHWKTHEKFTVGAKTEVKLDVPALAGLKVEVSAEVELGSERQWGGSEQRTYKVAQTVTVPPHSAVSVNAYVEWVDDYTTPFTVYFRLTGRTGEGALSREDLRKILEVGSFAGSVEDGTKPGQLLVGLPGDFTGSWGFRKVVDLKTIPFD